MQTPPSSQINSQLPALNKWIRHPNDTTVIPQGVPLLIEGTYVFEIDMARLRQHSVALNDIMSIPSDFPLDGTADRPIEIPHISGEDFSHFINWFNQQPWSSGQPSKAVLLSILAISHRFMIDAGVEFSINCLDSLNSDEALRPAHRLQLGFRYKVKKWIFRAVDDIFDWQDGRKQLRLIGNDDIDQMGARAFVLIAKGIETVQASWTSVALNVPTACHASQCQQSHQREQECTQAWREFWRAVVPQILLAAEQPTPLQELAGFIRRTEVKHVDNACKLLTLLHLEKAGVLAVELSTRKHVASSIWDLYHEGYM